jgi:hypothetical protein
MQALLKKIKSGVKTHNRLLKIANQLPRLVPGYPNRVLEFKKKKKIYIYIYIYIYMSFWGLFYKPLFSMFHLDL